MNKENIKVALKQIGACLEKDLVVSIPEVEDPVIIGLDYWGESKRFQTLHYDAGVEEPSVQVRYDAEGKVVEILLNSTEIRVVTVIDRDSDWELERDGIKLKK